MKRILLPVINNIPLFIISILLLGGFDVSYHQLIFHENNAANMISAYGEMIVMSYLICLCAWWCRKIHLKAIFYIILFIIYTTNCYLRFAYSTDISPKILLLLFETNSKEISGFFKTYFLSTPMYKTLFITSTMVVIMILGEHYRKGIANIMSKRVGTYIIYAILLFGIVGGASAFVRYGRITTCKNTFEAERWLMKIPFRKGMPLPNLVYSANAIRMSSEDLNHMISATETAIQDVSCQQSDSLNIVLVIGESYNKYHASLYGYYLDTTPYQREEQAKGRLYAFSHVKAPHNMTSIVLKNVLCCNDIHEEERWYDYPFFPAIFKKAGFDVWLWDNQYKWDPDAAWAFTLNSIIFNEQIQKLSYTAINEEGQTYDAGLITDFEQKKKSKMGSHNLIIFHLGGQHFPASMQYPQEPEYKVFSASDIKEKASYLDDNSRQRLADYANATRYNDSVIHQITKLVDDTNALVIYFPDHGEEVYDYRDFYGRQVIGEEDKITPQLIKYQLEIPFIIWCSDRWKAIHEAEWAAISQAINREFTTDNICHLLFRLAGIQTKFYKPERDLISPKFVPQTKAYNILSL